MKLSQKCQYAVRAILELSLQTGDQPLSAAAISENQAVPKRFMEVILNELRPSGLLEAHRGARGGYVLARPPSLITIGEVIRLVDGPLDPVRCSSSGGESCCPRREHCPLAEVWTKARHALEEVYDQTTFQQLADRERELRDVGATDYCI